MTMFNTRFTNKKKGFTLIELIFVVLLLSIMLYTIWRVFIVGARTSTRLTQSTQLASHTRMCDTKMQRELRLAVKIISPVVTATPQSSPVVVFTNQLNELIVYYVNKENKLIRQNRTLGNIETTLSNNVSAFRAFRKGRRLLNYHIELSVDDNKMVDKKRRFSLISSVTLRNSFN